MSKNTKQKVKKLWDNILLRNIFLAVAAIVVLLIFSSVFLDLFTRHGKSAPVPDFTGKTMDSVLIIAEKNHLRIEIIDSLFRIDAPRGSVFLQNPEAGTHVKKNRKIFVTLNSFSPRKETVPNVKERSLRQAKTELNAKGFRIGKLEYVHKYERTNLVLAQLYRKKEIEPGVLLPVGEHIDLQLGLDSASYSISIPNVVGLKRQMAEDVIIENSLNYILSFEGKGIRTITDSLNCVVSKQEPPAGSKSYFGNNVRIWLKLPEKK
ncbi:MAG: PASTA domain-containing protein [Prevotellaceae bacterium]|jgi:beta-lactam-binding protein with PASTA domain|nr:PASTA domain-containing protein [Prevotellaceae bacterium]